MNPHLRWQPRHGLLLLPKRPSALWWSINGREQMRTQRNCFNSPIIHIGIIKDVRAWVYAEQPSMHQHAVCFSTESGTGRRSPTKFAFPVKVIKVFIHQRDPMQKWSKEPLLNNGFTCMMRPVKRHFLKRVKVFVFLSSTATKKKKKTIPFYLVRLFILVLSSMMILPTIALCSPWIYAPLR